MCLCPPSTISSAFVPSLLYPVPVSPLLYPCTAILTLPLRVEVFVTVSGGATEGRCHLPHTRSKECLYILFDFYVVQPTMATRRNSVRASHTNVHPHTCVCPPHTHQNWWTPLHAAANKGHKNCVQLLLDFVAAVDQPDRESMTPLHWAAKRGHREVRCGRCGVISQMEVGDDSDQSDVHRRPSAGTARRGVGTAAANLWAPRDEVWGHQRQQNLDGVGDRNSKRPEMRCGAISTTWKLVMAVTRCACAAKPWWAS